MLEPVRPSRTVLSGRQARRNCSTSCRPEAGSLPPGPAATAARRQPGPPGTGLRAPAQDRVRLPPVTTPRESAPRGEELTLHIAKLSMSVKNKVRTSAQVCFPPPGGERQGWGSCSLAEDARRLQRVPLSRVGEG